MAQESYSLYQLNNYVKQVLALNFEVAIWVEAEISQVNQSRGHLYVDLIEQDETTENVKAHARGNIWAGQLSILKRKHGKTLHEVLQDGQMLKLLVKVQFHERWGYSLNIQDIDPAYTIGKLALEREKVLETLRTEKLFDLNKSYQLPAVLQHIAVISSETAAGLKDFEETLFQNEYGYAYDIDLYAAAMQGVNTEPEISHILNKVFPQTKRYDLVVIIRGGGSRIDLAAFDGINLARAIAMSKIPVWTGIGHEIDVSIADMMAHTHFKTPTAVAERIIQHNVQFEQDILSIAHQLEQSASLQLKDEQDHIENALDILLRRLEQERYNLTRNWEQIQLTTDRRIERIDSKLDKQAALLKALHPEQVLRRGYTITHVEKPNRKELVSGDRLVTQWIDQEVSSEVINKKT